MTSTKSTTNNNNFLLSIKKNNLHLFKCSSATNILESLNDYNLNKIILLKNIIRKKNREKNILLSNSSENENILNLEPNCDNLRNNTNNNEISINNKKNNNHKTLKKSFQRQKK